MSNLGKIGEKKFDLWCSEADLTCNKSNEDETGWDFSVEFPLELGRPGALSHDGALECKVQVKTTQTTKPSTQIKISNLHRFASSPLPCFIVLFVCDQERKITDVYVRHVDQKLIAAIIEKTHKLRVSEQLNKLHKKEMVIHFRKKERLKSLKSSALREVLAMPMTKGLHSYSQAKQDYLSSCGYTDNSVTGSMTFADEDAVEKFVDMMLGYGGSVPVENVKISRKRFDVEEVVPEPETARISIDATTPSHEAILRVKTGIFETPVTFPISAYLPPFLDKLPKKLIAIRVSTGIIDMKFKPYTGAGQFVTDLNLDDNYELLEVRNSLWLLKKLSSGEPLNIEIQPNSEDAPSLSGSVRGTKQAFMYEEALEGLNAALNLIGHLNVTEKVRLTIQQAEIQSLGLVQTYGLFKSKDSVVRVEFTSDAELDERIKHACPWIVQTALGNMLITLVVTLIGMPEKINGLRYRVTSAEPVVSRSFVQSPGRLLTDDERIELLGEAQREYEDKYHVVTLQP